MTLPLDRLPEIPGYQIVGELGTGGMGTVFLAQHHGPHGFEKLVALKVLRPGCSDTTDVRSMFIDEARLAAQLAHPCIAQVHSFGEADGTLYFVMEHVTGLTFSELMRAAPLPPLISASLASRVCRGLHAAHELRNLRGLALAVVHRDVTPQNLVLTFDGEVKILDFGIALMQERTAPRTMLRIVRGKPTYLAPEQRVKDVVDRRADIYSLSIVLYEMLTQRKLFSFDMPWALWKEVAQNVPPPSITTPLPKGLDEIVLKGLAYDPADRFQTAREMATAIEQLLEAEGSETIESFAERELDVFRRAHLEQMRFALDCEEESTTQVVRIHTQVDGTMPRQETLTKMSEARPPALRPSDDISIVVPRSSWIADSGVLTMFFTMMLLVAVVAFLRL